MKEECRPRLLERGVCRHCLKNPVTVGADGGTRLCDACREEAARILDERYRTDTRRYVKAQGDALHAFPEDRRALTALGFCAHCGIRRATLGPRGGRTLCDECRAYHAQTRSDKDGNVARKRDAREERAAKGLCVYCSKPVLIAGPRGSKRWCADCRARWLQVRSDRLDRRDAVEIYGNTCADCGTTDIRVLEFHHTNHDGYLMKRKGGGGSGRLARQIRQAGHRIDGIEMICANCHRIRHWDARYGDNVFG